MGSSSNQGAKAALTWLCFIILPSLALSSAVYHSVRYRDEKPWQRRTPSRFFFPDTGLDYSAGSSIRRESVYREPAPTMKERVKAYKPYKSGGLVKSKDFFRIKKRLEPKISNDIAGSSIELDNSFRQPNYPKSFSPNLPPMTDPNTRALYSGGLVYLLDFRPGSRMY